MAAARFMTDGRGQDAQGTAHTAFDDRGGAREQGLGSQGVPEDGSVWAVSVGTVLAGSLQREKLA